MVWSSNPQEPQWVPKPGWWASPPEPSRPFSTEWFNPNHERTGKSTGAGTLVATARQVERVDAAFGGEGAFTPSASNAKIPIIGAFDNLDSSANGKLYSGLSAWGWPLRVSSISFSGNGVTTATAEDHIDGLSALSFASYQTLVPGATPNAGTLIGSVFQKYSVAAQFSGGSFLHGDANPLGGLPDGLSATVLPESDVVAYLDNEGILDGEVISQIYANSVRAFSGGGSLSATVVPQGTSAVTLTGTGVLSGVTVGQMSRSAALSNTGLLGVSATTQIYTNNVLTLTGTGALGNNVVQKYDSSASLTGTGALGGGTTQTYSVAASFSASGTMIPNYYPGNTDGLWASAYSKYAAAENEDGSGTLGGSVSQIYSVPTGFAGSGSLTATARMYQATVAGVLASTGSLSATVVPQRIARTPNFALGGGDYENTGIGIPSWLGGAYSTEQAYDGTHSWKWSASTNWNGPFLCADYPVRPGDVFDIRTHVRPHVSNDMSTGYLTVSARFWNHPTARDWATNWAGDSGWVNLNNNAMSSGWQEHNTIGVVPAGAVAMEVWLIASPETVDTNMYYADGMYLAGLPTITSVGALSGAAYAKFASAATLSGNGALTGSARMYQIGSAATLSSSGALTATRTSQYYEVRSAALSSSGNLSATALPVVSSGTLVTTDLGFETYGNSTEQARSGTKSVKLVADGVNWQSWPMQNSDWAWRDCTPGQQIYGEIWFYGKSTNVQSGLDAVGLTVSFQDSTGVNGQQWPGTSYVTSPATTNGVWTKMCYTATVPAGYDRYVAYCWVHINATAGDAYYFDDPVVRTVNILQGGGSLTATRVPVRSSGVTLSGSGAMSGTGYAVYARSAALSGNGALAGSARMYQIGSAPALSGSGTLSATRTSQYYEVRSAALSGGGSLSATASQIASAAASFTSGGTLSATATPLTPAVDSHGYSTAAPGSSSSTMTASYSHTFNATSTFILCVVGYYASSTLAPPAPGTITVGSTNMTLITSANAAYHPSSGACYMRMSWYQATGIAAGTQTVTASWTGLNTSIAKATAIFGYGITGSGTPTWGGGATSGTGTATSWSIATGLDLTGKLTLAIAGIAILGAGAHIDAVSSPLVGDDQDIMPIVATRLNSAHIPYASGTTGMSLTFTNATAKSWYGSYITI